jgi:hypothetical protein
MSVDSIAYKVVFCEGKPGSLDYLLLTHLLPTRVRIRPVGGKHGLQAYIQGYLATYPSDASPAYVALRDRDFDYEPPETPQLIPLKEPLLWLTHRAAVENYLIDANLLHTYWREHEHAPAWQHGPARSTDDIEARIAQSAQDLADYQAVRWGLARLKPGTRWPEINTTWTKEGSGDLPSSLAFDDCLAHACELATAFHVQLQGIRPDQLQEQADVYRQRFHEQRFLDRREYLVWFHGKDHLAQLCRRLTPNFPRRHYADWAAEHVNIEQYPEFQQLIALAS